MNSIWNKNIRLFRERFPALADMLQDTIESFAGCIEAGAAGGTSAGEPQAEAQAAPLPYRIETAKNGSPTASENAAMLHSKYNPEREADQQITSFKADEMQSAIFFSCGLGYAPIAFCRKYASVPLIIIEERADYILQAFAVLDWTPVLTHTALTLLIAADTDSAAGVLRQYDLKKACLFSVPAQGAHSAEYFKALRLLIAQEKRKDETNTATLEKFARLWLSNTCRNIRQLDLLDGICKYAGLGAGLPFVVLAAGPSLGRVLPELAELKRRAVIVCVDTALHSCLEAGVEPDFIVLVDPQYACAMHLEFLSAPTSILITEVAAWPSVFRFSCREKVLCSSMYPPGQYFESKLWAKGKLGAGGSVATTAWDFARFCGAHEIFLAGMDLGFPGRQTHIRGSQFEEREHRISSRLYTSESQSTAALLSANPIMLRDYNGNELLSDKKMSLFSWWFEKNCAVAGEQGVRTYSLTAESLAIAGIESYSLEQFLEREDQTTGKAAFFAAAQERSGKSTGSGSGHSSASNGPGDKNSAIDSPGSNPGVNSCSPGSTRYTPGFDAVLTGFLQDLAQMQSLAAKGITLCEKAIANRLKAPEVFAELDKIDRAIMQSETKDAAALVFPTERKLKELTKDLPEDKTLSSLFYSRIIYRELKKACADYVEFFSSFQSLPR